MGRARRNQRDDIRKRRALKRKKVLGKSDDEIDSSLAKKLLSVRQQQLSKLDSSHDVKHHESVDECKSMMDHETISQSNIEDTTSNASNKEEKSIPVKPLNNIERMRLRKQERKAKRKAKKNLQV